MTGREFVNRAVKNIDPDAAIYHDDYRSYGMLDGSFRHESVNHSAGEYVRELFNMGEPRTSVFPGHKVCVPPG